MNYKRGLAVVVGCVTAALVSFAATYPRFHPAAPAGVVAPTPAASDASAGKTATPSEPSLVAGLNPLRHNGSPLAWARLTDAQRAALAPFAGQWDRFSEARRRKWLRIAARYPRMSPDAQKRLHDRMNEWVRMTPDQRRIARENYQASKSLPPQARQKAWKAYQQLPEDQKERLAASERRRRTVVSAPPTGKPEIRDIERLVDGREHRAGHAPVALSPATASVPASGVAPAAPLPPATPTGARPG
ncbi:hypothetical protein CY652_17495 [Burkholderia sp. WAC0059]|uniref:DUF3106 domain-containing protein n=1 Tax=Burkholderia sp. WAC0059 TaxID=2066022 RepID=UPI000C7F0822|nr:DUF3106 domain-containing protein [Burkholderia sp. WAC0059]PLZ01082.1 hypothetical protein CY652_17495 [Burkholderia sp. WAC0059]